MTKEGIMLQQNVYSITRENRAAGGGQPRGQSNMATQVQPPYPKQAIWWKMPRKLINELRCYCDSLNLMLPIKVQSNLVKAPVQRTFLILLLFPQSTLGPNRMIMLRQTYWLELIKMIQTQGSQVGVLLFALRNPKFSSAPRLNLSFHPSSKMYI